jgi:enoyl-CoA hydratase/carnithine racemase
MEPSLVVCSIDEHIAQVTLNHPARRNALSRLLLLQLKEQLTRLATDPSVRVVILRAAGAAFSAGHDLRELVEGDTEEHAALFTLCTSVMEGVRQLPQPVIAAVQGIATAAGCQLVASCDLVVAAEEAVFATPGVKIGLFCSTPAVALSRVVPPRKALEMLFTGTPISAREAERIGLINRVVPAQRLDEEALQLARQIATATPSTLTLGKRAFYEQLPLDRPAAYRVAEKIMVENTQADDAQEGMRAFLEKRPPRWTE